MIIFLDAYEVDSYSVFCPDSKNITHFLIGLSYHEIWALIGREQILKIRVMVSAKTPKQCLLSSCDVFLKKTTLKIN